MKISISGSSTQDAVNAINAKLGTDYTVFDYAAWESGMDTEGSREFAAAVEKYIGGAEYRMVTTLALAVLKLKRLFRNSG